MTTISTKQPFVTNNSIRSPSLMMYPLPLVVPYLLSPLLLFVPYLTSYCDYQSCILSICHSIIPTEPIEYQKEPAIVTTHPTALIMLSGCLKMITEMIITQTCFTFPAILITRGEVDFVASKLETFRANAMKPLNTNNKYI